jgi:hypothetical protein
MRDLSRISQSQRNVDARFIAYPQIAAHRRYAIYRVSPNRDATSMRDLSRISQSQRNVDTRFIAYQPRNNTIPGQSR